MGGRRCCRCQVLLRRFSTLLAFSRILAGQSKFCSTSVKRSACCRHRRNERMPTNAMSARMLPVAFRSELVTLVTRTADSAADWSRRGVFANGRASLHEGISLQSVLETGTSALISLVVEKWLIFRMRQGISQGSGGRAVAGTRSRSVSRQLQLFQDVLRALGKRIQPDSLRRRHPRRLRSGRERREWTVELRNRGG